MVAQTRLTGWRRIKLNNHIINNIFICLSVYLNIFAKLVAAQTLFIRIWLLRNCFEVFLDYELLFYQKWFSFVANLRRTLRALSEPWLLCSFGIFLLQSSFQACHILMLALCFFRLILFADDETLGPMRIIYWFSCIDLEWEVWLRLNKHTAIFLKQLSLWWFPQIILHWSSKWRHGLVD